jgi:excisionase family DNA binding protein
MDQKVVARMPSKGTGTPSSSQASRWLTTTEAAEYLGLEPGTLCVWRSTGRYSMPYHKVGRAVRYLRDDLDAWLESRRVGA